MIDDDPITCQLITLMLERTGYTVRTATSAAGAWQKLKQEMPDVICW